MNKLLGIKVPFSNEVPSQKSILTRFNYFLALGIMLFFNTSTFAQAGLAPRILAETGPVQQFIPVVVGSDPFHWEAGINADFIETDCSLRNEIRLRVQFINPYLTEVLENNIQFKIRIKRISFADMNNAWNQNNGYDGLGDYSSDINENLSTVHYSLVYEVPGNEPNNSVNFDKQITILVEDGFAYFAEVKFRKHNWTGSWQSTWAVYHSENLNFRLGTTGSSADAVLLNEVSTRVAAGFNGWQVNVSQMDSNEPIIVDAEASDCEGNYQYTVQEFDLATWQPVGTPATSGWIPGEAPSNIDITNELTYSHGKIYHVSVAVGPVWNAKDLFFEYKDAEVEAVLNNIFNTRHITIPVLGGGYESYQIDQICTNSGSVILDVSNTLYEDHYSYEIMELNNSMYPISTLFDFSSNNPAPSSLNLSTAGLLPGKIYQVAFMAGSPNITINRYFEIKVCPRVSRRGVVADSDSENSMDIAQEVSSLFPNPTNSEEINLMLKDYSGSVNVQVFDLNGKLMHAEQLKDSFSHTLYLKDYPSGMYIVQIMNNEQSEVLKFIKN